MKEIKPEEVVAVVIVAVAGVGVDFEEFSVVVVDGEDVSFESNEKDGSEGKF